MSLPGGVASDDNMNLIVDGANLMLAPSNIANPNSMMNPTSMTPLTASDSVYCSRCRNYKKINEFMDGIKRRKTCTACRLYGKRYIKEKKGETGLNLGSNSSSSSSLNNPTLVHISGHLNGVEPLETKNILKYLIENNEASVEDLISGNQKFIDNMRWMMDHIEQNIDNLNHIAALNHAFGKPVEDARETIEVELQNSVNANMESLA